MKAENISAWSGVMGDYDKEQMQPETASELLADHSIAHVIYTSPSHKPDKPRWRLLVPFSTDKPVDEMHRHVDQVQAILGGVLGYEAWNGFRRYFYMGVDHPPQVIAVDGTAIDQVADLPAIDPVDRPAGWMAGSSDKDDSGPVIIGEATEAEKAKVAEEMADMVERCANADIGDRYLTQNKSIFKLAGWAVHGAVTEEQARAAMFPAMLASGKTQREAERIFKAAWRDGLKKPQKLPFVVYDDDWPELPDELTELLDGKLSVEEQADAWLAEILNKPKDDNDNPIDAPVDDKPKKKSKAKIEWFHKAELPTAAPYLVRGILDQGTVSCLYGAPNAGKTFAAIDLCHALASAEEGSTWNGAKIKRAAVLYCALEGGLSFEKRILAVLKHTGKRERIPFMYRRGGANLIKPESDEGAKADVTLIIEAAMKLQKQECAAGLPLMIVIDTLSRSMPGADENSAHAMTALIENIDLIREETGAHVMIVHHTGKDATKGMRGHSALLGAVDSELEVSRPNNGKIVSLDVKKQRDNDSDYHLADGELINVELGRDEEGDPIMSAVLQWGAEPAAKPVTLSKNQQAVLNVLEKAGGRIDKTEWQEKCVDEMIGSNAKDEKSRRDSIRRIIKYLNDKGLIENIEGDFYDKIDPADKSVVNLHADDFDDLP